MIQIKFKKGRIPFKKLRDLLESGLDGEEFELPEVLCSNSIYYLYQMHHYGISDTWSIDLISKNTGRTLKYLSLPLRQSSGFSNSGMRPSFTWSTLGR